jgi:L-lactate dehydrogenase complex protein LldG
MSNVSNPSRERILARIRKGLNSAQSNPVPIPGRPAFPPLDDLLERFVLECKGNLTECVVCNGDTKSQLNRVLETVSPGSIFGDDSPQIRQLLNGSSREIIWSSTEAVPEMCQAAVTRAEALIAQTGSMLVSSSLGGRGAFVVPPVHIVVASESQLLPDLEAAMKFASEKQLAEHSSYLQVITGCSRTGDIEKLLVIGAHGPKRLIVLLEN